MGRTQQGRVFAAVREGARASLDVAAVIGLPVAHASSHLRMLAEAGRLERTGTVRFSPVGRSALPTSASRQTRTRNSSTGMCCETLTARRIG